MSVQTDLARFTIEQFAERFRREMVPLGNRISYFFIGLPLGEEDLKEYVEEPIGALPPSIAAKLPKLSICLVPYIERVNGKESSRIISLAKPAEHKQALSARLAGKDDTMLVFAVEGREVADYHYRLYREIAEMLVGSLPPDVEAKYFGQLREELSGHVHGEVDQESWRLKQALTHRGGNAKRETKAFREYAMVSFVDTMTLYMHGICCDIDVDTGPRQLPSRYLRKRLMLLKEFYPPPANYAVFPEDLQD
jgi:hypothetical protein